MKSLPGAKANVLELVQGAAPLLPGSPGHPMNEELALGPRQSRCLFWERHGKKYVPFFEAFVHMTLNLPQQLTFCVGSMEARL